MFCSFDHNPLINLHPITQASYKFILQRRIPACVLTNALKVELLLTQNIKKKYVLKGKRLQKIIYLFNPFFL